MNKWYDVLLFPVSKITTLIREYMIITELKYKT